jgi:hypothetical protein
MSDPLSIILRIISNNSVIAPIVAAVITGIVTWLSRPKPAKEHVDPRVEIVRLNGDGENNGDN